MYNALLKQLKLIMDLSNYKQTYVQYVIVCM